MNEPRILLSESTVRRVLCTIVGEHSAWQFASRELPEHRELFTFGSGAKLYRLGTHLWTIRGYFCSGSDVERAMQEFNDARRLVLQADALTIDVA